LKLLAQDLKALAAELNFQEEVLDKVLRLLSLLEAFRKAPFLDDQIVLKGGTALNLFLFNVPRLSVDIDLNYVGSSMAATMTAERPKLEQVIAAICGRESLTVKRIPADHAGGKWRLTYINALDRNANLEIDLNFMLRVPLWPVQRLDSRPIGPYQARSIPVLDFHELAAGKLVTLLARHASRDLFDARQILQHQELEPDKLRAAFVVYGAFNRKDWRTVAIDDVDLDVEEVRRQLLPVLRGKTSPKRSELQSWTAQLVADCRQQLQAVLPFREHERAFLENLLEHGEIEPELLTRQPELVERIRHQPLLRWKATNVRKHKDLPPLAEVE